MKLRHLVILKVALLICLGLLAFFIWPGLAQSASSIVINEIMYALPGADDKHEWIEIYNNGSMPIDLTDWKLNDGDGSTNHALNAPPKNNSRGSMVLNPDNYALLADDAATLAADLPNYQGPIIDTVISLLDTGATLKLLNKDSIEITSTSYSKTMGAFRNNKTLEWDGAALKESSIDGGTPGKINSVLTGTPAISSPSPSPSASATPSVSATPSASPSASPTPYQYSQNIFINEFLPYPSKDELEWVELFNGGSQAIDLTGWGLGDSETAHQPFQVSGNTKIEPGAYLVVSLSKSFLNNDGDQVKLLWPDGQLIHSVSYQKAKQNFSCSRFDNQWLWTNQPTPGQANKKPSFASSPSPSQTITSSPPQISPLNEGVSAQTSAPTEKTNMAPTTTGATPAPLTNPKSNPENDLTAATAQPIAKNSRWPSIFSLAAVLLIALITALTLLRFKKISVDRQKMSD